MPRPKIAKTTSTQILKHVSAAYPLHVTVNSKIGILESRGKKYIVKERYEDGLKREWRWLNLLRDVHFSHIPKTYGKIRFDGKPVLLQEYVEGTKLERDKNTFNRYSQRIAHILAELFLKTKTKTRPAYTSIADQLASIEHIYKNTTAICEHSGLMSLKPFLTQGFEAFQTVSKIMEQRKDELMYHTPISLVNSEMEFIIDKKEKIYMIDWENGRYDDVAYDIADLQYVFPNMNMAEFTAEFIKASSASPTVLRRARLFFPIIIIKEYFYELQNRATIEFYRNMPAQIINLLTQMKLKERLSRLSSALSDLEKC